MTANGDHSTGISPALRSGGISVKALAQAVKTVQKTSTVSRFWASSRRPQSSKHREVLEISFGSPRLLNHVSLDVSKFPLVLTMEYLDAKKRWRPITYAQRHVKGPRREYPGHPVTTAINYSTPRRVNSAAATSHPQHFGSNHWLNESWSITPVSTSKIRFVLVRSPRGPGPRDFSGIDDVRRGRRVDYSLALRNVQVGYRVNSRVDLPRPPIVPPPTPAQPAPEDWWASSKDILGSRVVYSTYEQDARAAIDNNTSTYWRSEPQPFPFAVVNLYLDIQNVNGVAPVVDRWWVDPVSVGPVCNVYYSDDDPLTDFDGVSDPIPDAYRAESGHPVVVTEGETGTAISVDLGPTDLTGVTVNNHHTRMHYSRPWWLGLDAATLAPASDTQTRPLASIGSTEICQEGYGLLVRSGDRTARIPLDPDIFVMNSGYRLVVAYFPADPASLSPARLQITAQSAGYDAIQDETAVTLVDSEDPIRIGLSPAVDSTNVAAVSIKGLVLKAEALVPEVLDWFLAEGEVFVADPLVPSQSRMTAQNSILRIHPSFTHPTINVFGLVGGYGNRFEEMAWTPVTRDYTLKRGYLHIPPTRARYWKFEMTRLLPEVYENFVTIDREALVFPPGVVDAHNRATSGSPSDATPSGVNATTAAAGGVEYQDVLAAARSQSSPDATDVLILSDPHMAKRAAASGWIWTYQPWHVGSSAPQFVGTQVHHYESITVSHSTKTAFFAGIKELRPYRVDYTYDDDTPEYIEHMLDTAFIDEPTMISVDHAAGSLTASSANGEVTSKRLMSYRTVRGVQFATQETDSVEVLPDPGLVNEALSLTEYGDAKVHWDGPGDVRLSRGWFPLHYSDLEAFTYGDLDGKFYGTLEGNNPKTGFAEGGAVSVAYTPSGAGKITAKAQVSADGGVHLPIRLEILSTHDDSVLASADALVQPGETASLHTGYSVGVQNPGTPGAVLPRTYADVEGGKSSTKMDLGEDIQVEQTHGTIVGSGAILSDTSDLTYATAAAWSGGVGFITANVIAEHVGSRVGHVNVTLLSQWDAPVDGLGTTVNVMLLRGSDQAPVATGSYSPTTGLSGAVVTLLPMADTDDARATLATALATPCLLSIAPVQADPSLYTSGVQRVLTVTHAEVLVVGADNGTYGSLDGTLYGSLEHTETADVYYSRDVYLRVRQLGKSDDSFHLHSLALYDSPIAWFFSNDDGATWWQAIDVRNDPNSVLLFPENRNPDPTPETGRALRWKARLYRSGATINALYIRPWYGSHSRSTAGAHTMDALGPNQSIYDLLPELPDHPMWLDRSNAIEFVVDPPAVITPFWRNLFPTPSGEGSASALEAVGGTIVPQATWIALLPTGGAS